MRASALNSPLSPTSNARNWRVFTSTVACRPIQAALTSAATFAVDAVMPLAMVMLMPRAALVVGVSVATLLFLSLLGAIGARAGGVNLMKATLRFTFWGALAMGLTAGIGALFGTVV